MAQIGPSGRRGAACDVSASGKRRNAPEGPICATGGRVLLCRGVVALVSAMPGIAHRNRAQYQRSLIMTPFTGTILPAS